MAECQMAGCQLTALWQVGVDFIKSWAPSEEPIHTVTNLTICGLDRERVRKQHFQNLIDDLSKALPHPFGSSWWTELTFTDISDGTWIDPTSGTRKPIPFNPDALFTDLSE